MSDFFRFFLLRPAWSLVPLSLLACSPGGEITFSSAARNAAGAAGSSAGVGGSAAGGAGGAAAGTSGASGQGAAACQPCVTDKDCPGARCAQLPADTFCAASCHTDKDCGSDQTCTMLTSAEGAQIQVCVSLAEACPGGAGAGGASGQGGAGDAGTSAGGGAGGAAGPCGALVGPDVSSCCHSCSGPTCQPNGCYGGWFCNQDSCKCQSPPSPATCEGAGGSGGGATACSGPVTLPTGGPVTAQGGTLDALRFAIVGDTRPASKDDTAAYPTAIIQKIWQRVELQKVPFAITTGDYMFADIAGNQGSLQLDRYLCARSSFSGMVFPALGNHECTGATASNCGPGGKDGITKNYAVFTDRMLTPLGLTLPYYTLPINATDGSWSAKLVFIAANAWTEDQATWLKGELAKPTTYTFLVRHENRSAKTAPGVTPSETIMAQYPYTLLLAGHTHTFDYSAAQRQVIIGNGGAPLSGSSNYGFALVERQADGSILIAARDYQTGEPFQSFAVKADGTPVP